jgi:glutamate/tyrosine decarboxylase-like PLP-dependent enzyme
MCRSTWTGLGGHDRTFPRSRSDLDFRLPRVASTNASDHKYGRVFLGVGRAIWRDSASLSEDLDFRVNHLAGDMPTSVCAELLASWRAGRGAMLQLPKTRFRGFDRMERELRIL